jgi:hypothetical protein
MARDRIESIASKKTLLEKGREIASPRYSLLCSPFHHIRVSLLTNIPHRQQRLHKADLLPHLSSGVVYDTLLLLVRVLCERNTLLIPDAACFVTSLLRGIRVSASYRARYYHYRAR